MVETRVRKLVDLRHVLSLNHMRMVYDRLNSQCTHAWKVIHQVRWHMWDALLRADPVYADRVVSIPDARSANARSSYACPPNVLAALNVVWEAEGRYD